MACFPRWLSIALWAACSRAVHALPPQQFVGSLQPNSLVTVHEELKIADIIPSIIDDFTPLLELNVTWSHKAVAELGNDLKPKHLQHAPTINLHHALHPEGVDQTLFASRMTFTVVLTDPDAPSRDDPKWSQICHWIATGIPLSHPSSLETAYLVDQSQKMKQVMKYKPPGPPPKTGKHRYIFIAFAPANGTEKKLHLSKPSDRQHWGGNEEGYGVREWAAENGLKPVAANFIYAQNKKQ